MAVLRIAKMGNPVLLQKAAPVDDPTAPEIRRLAADMQDTIEDIGASGLAAPQVFVPKRVVVYRMIAARIPPGWANLDSFSLPGCRGRLARNFLMLVRSSRSRKPSG